MAKKSGLGRGLGALLNDNKPLMSQENLNENGIVELDLNLLQVREDQPRKVFDQKAIEDLAESLKDKGVLQPILVRKISDKYQIIAGERRFRAAKLAKLKKIPAIIKDLDDREVMEISLIENIQREDLNPVEEALAYLNLMNEFSYSQEEMSKKVGKSRSYIANTIRLLDLDEDCLESLKEGQITSNQARSLLAIKDLEKRKDFLDKLIAKEINIRDIEEKARELKKIKKKKKTYKDIFICDCEENLSEKFETKINIVAKKKGGRIEISYYDNSDLERIINILGR